MDGSGFGCNFYTLPGRILMDADETHISISLTVLAEIELQTKRSTLNDQLVLRALLGYQEGGEIRLVESFEQINPADTEEGFVFARTRRAQFQSM
jgi:hypothetical protein